MHTSFEQYDIASDAYADVLAARARGDVAATGAAAMRALCAFDRAEGQDKELSRLEARGAHDVATLAGYPASLLGKRP